VRSLGRSYYLVKKSSIITGRDLRSARRSQDEFNQPNVQFGLVPSAADKFGEYTGSHIGTPMAIVLDGNVHVGAGPSAPGSPTRASSRATTPSRKPRISR
jgi:preprotein translocase subunit SecD